MNSINAYKPRAKKAKNAASGNKSTVKRKISKTTKKQKAQQGESESESNTEGCASSDENKANKRHEKRDSPLTHGSDLEDMFPSDGAVSNYSDGEIADNSDIKLNNLIEDLDEPNSGAFPLFVLFHQLF